MGQDEWEGASLTSWQRRAGCHQRDSSAQGGGRGGSWATQSPQEGAFHLGASTRESCWVRGKPILSRYSIIRESNGHPFVNIS